MQNKDSVLGKLIAELDTVTADIGVHGHWNSSRSVFKAGREHHTVTVFVTAQFTGSDIETSGTTHWIEGVGPTREMALEDALQKFALAAPQQVSA